MVAMEKWLKPWLAANVAFVWTVSMFVDAFSETYEMHFAVHGLMMTVVGAILGVQIIKKNGDST